MMTDYIMSKKEAVYWHRIMWNWIAQTSIQEERCVLKKEALEHFGFYYKPRDFCFCCEYAFVSIDSNCNKCPIVWIGDSIFGRCYYGEFGTWRIFVDMGDYISAAKWAYIIAELPERKDQSYDF